MIKKYFFIFSFLSVLLVFSFYNGFYISQYNSIIFKVYSFLPLIDKNHTYDKTIEFVKSDINLILNLLFTVSEFTYYRSKKLEGFDRKILLKIHNLHTFNFKIKYIKFENGFAELLNVEKKIKQSEKQRVIRFLSTSGIIVNGDSLVKIKFDSYEDIKHLNITAIKNAVKSMIKTGVYKKYGNKFVFKITGNFILINSPIFIIRAGNLYCRVKGYIIFKES